MALDTALVEDSLHIGVEGNGVSWRQRRQRGIDGGNQTSRTGAIVRSRQSWNRIAPQARLQLGLKDIGVSRKHIREAIGS